ncbi:hypothetical protein HaLaN_08783, partial [Haematococcus lacustris]
LSRLHYTSFLPLEKAFPAPGHYHDRIADRSVRPFVPIEIVRLRGTGQEVIDFTLSGVRPMAGLYAYRAVVPHAAPCPSHVTTTAQSKRNTGDLNGRLRPRISRKGIVDRHSCKLTL